MTLDELATQIKDYNIIMQQAQNNREKSKVLEVDNNIDIVIKLAIGTVTLNNIILIALQNKWIDKPREDATASIINTKLELPRARQYINKGKRIQDPILDRVNKYLNKLIITEEKQNLIVKDWI